MTAAQTATFADAEKFIYRQNKLTQATAKARKNLTAAEERLLLCQKAMAGASAARLAAAPEDTKAEYTEGIARDALAKAHTSLEEAKLCVIGCNNAEYDTDPEPLLKMLRPALETFRQEEVDKALKEFGPARAAYLTALQKLSALAAALGVGVKPNSELPEDAPAYARSLSTAILEPPKSGNWQTAQPIFEQHKQPHQLIKALERAAAERQTARDRIAQTKAPRGTFDPEGVYIVTDSSLRIRGVDFPQGSRFTQHDCGPSGVALLARLVAVGKLRLLGEEQLIA